MKRKKRKSGAKSNPVQLTEWNWWGSTASQSCQSISSDDCVCRPCLVEFLERQSDADGVFDEVEAARCWHVDDDSPLLFMDDKEILVVDSVTQPRLKGESTVHLVDIGGRTDAAQAKQQSPNVFLCCCSSHSAA